MLRYQYYKICFMLRVNIRSHNVVRTLSKFKIGKLFIIKIKYILFL